MQRRKRTLGSGWFRLAAAALWWFAIGLCATAPVETRTGVVADWLVATAFYAAFIVVPASIVEIRLMHSHPARHVPIVLLTAMVFSCLLFYQTTYSNPVSFAIAVVLNGACLVTLASLCGDVPWLGWLSRRVGEHHRWAALCGPVALVSCVAYVVWPGPDAPAQATGRQHDGVATILAPNPGAMGAYTYTRLAYGPAQQSGRVDLVSRRVDGSSIMPDWHRAFLDSRTRYWGFDAKELPLTGTAWLPAGAGPFPLVLITHGQAAMMAPLDQGFAYLGEFLASHGYIAATIDTSFLNGNWYALMIVPGLTLNDDFGARGWLMAEHLKQWHDWQATPGNPLYGKVDLQRVALIGHSRGGEAAALVADYVGRYGQPPNTKVKALICLAPTDANFLPGGERVRLSDLNYLVMVGGYDGDVTSPVGINQYYRVALGPGDNSKAAVFLEHATHNGFNSLWSGPTAPWPRTLLTNRAPLMTAQDQRLATQVFVGAFLEDALRQRTVYETLFRDHRAGEAWLPASASYRSVLSSSRDRLLDDFEDDRSAAPAVDGGQNHATGAVSATEGHAPLRASVNGASSYHETKAGILAWHTPGGEYEVSLPITATATWGTGRDSALVMNLANATRLMSRGEANLPAAGIDLTVFIRDAEGREGRLPLDAVEPIPPPPSVRLLKDELFSSSFIIFSQFELPLADFRAVDGSLDLGRISSVGLRFDRTPAGTVLIDDIAFRQR